MMGRVERVDADGDAMMAYNSNRSPAEPLLLFSSLLWAPSAAAALWIGVYRSETVGIKTFLFLRRSVGVFFSMLFCVLFAHASRTRFDRILLCYLQPNMSHICKPLKSCI